MKYTTEWEIPLISMGLLLHAVNLLYNYSTHVVLGPSGQMQSCVNRVHRPLSSQTFWSTWNCNILFSSYTQQRLPLCLQISFHLCPVHGRDVVWWKPVWHLPISLTPLIDQCAQVTRDWAQKLKFRSSECRTLTLALLEQYRIVFCQSSDS